MRSPRKVGRIAPEAPLARRWRVALAEAEMSETDWAASRGLTQSHVGQVVRGERASARLMLDITAFVEAQERALAKRLVTTAA